ncbi:radical SAM protein [Desulfitobacterium sp. Sab5]|uniref:radical SAM protein n=1 Tax=Desulfitobacterium nosdiversum TaxID=3375356 RepID=UPI003CECE5DC
MQLEKRFHEIIDKAQNYASLTKEECIYLLNFEETSLEASILRAVADNLSRKKAENSGVILGQIGVEVSECTGNCKFCVFGKEHTQLPTHRASDEELALKAQEFAGYGDLYGLFLMTMHSYDLDVILNAVEIVKKNIPDHTQIWVNIGDSNVDTFEELRRAGVKGAYHVNRLREGIDTDLNPNARRSTMEAVVSAGLDLYTCCEPIGPEHTPEEIVENFFIGIEIGCFQHAAMRRVAVPGVPLSKYGQITELRLAQIVAVITLATLNTKSMRYMSVHEPNQVGLLSGANVITAESGANPRDTNIDTSKGRGFSMANCRKMLFEAGFTSLRRGDESIIPLNLDYLKKTNSI